MAATGQRSSSTISYSRDGVMPNWGARLDDEHHQGTRGLRALPRRRAMTIQARCHRRLRRPAGQQEEQPDPLLAKRVKIHPKRASGFFRRLKWIVMAVTLSIYYVTPWLRWDRGPGAPDQAVLIDFAHRRFYFFFIETLAAGGLLPHRPADHGGHRPLPHDQCRRASMVRLYLSADGLDRSFPGRGARDRGRSQRAHQARSAPFSFSKLRKRVSKHAALAADRAWRRAAPGSSTSPTRRRWPNELIQFQAPRSPI